MKRLFPLALLALLGVALPSCDEESTPTPNGAFSPVEINYSLNMKGLSGSETQGMFGVAQSETEAQSAKGTLLSGSINWLDTKGGKEAKNFVLANRSKGEKLWVFVTSDEPLTAGQSVSVTWGVDKTLTLDATSPAVVVKEYTVQ